MKVHPMPEKPEIETLAELRAIADLAQHPGWKYILDGIAEEVSKAYEDMVGNLSNDPMSYMRLQIRWQQREIMKRAIEQYVDLMVQEHANILKEKAEIGRAHV